MKGPGYWFGWLIYGRWAQALDKLFKPKEERDA